MNNTRTLLYCIINEMGISPRLIGVDYLEEAILYTYENGRTSLTKSIYPMICGKFHTSQSNAYKSMYNAVKQADRNVIKNMFHDSLFGKNGNIKIGDFIFGVAKYIEIYEKTHQ